ncbi:hypothetical protein [Alicyclobacillus sp. SO9]|uniref:hypothetical protein n=1 Tax=Alicyclobacillus sp. SO9 TaxID=2665646 RepID=UPI0018E763C3|nr:hypothetical protein [Alicyclobacillus sp. SO9]QQE77616.1 hypothetical protein GI364_16955 [Alicyclobacillus sp. SO9]
MQIEQEMKNAKHHFDPKYNQGEFRDNVLRRACSKEPKPLKTRFLPKRKSVLIGIAATAIPVLVGFSYFSFNWHNGTFRFDQSPTTSQAPDISTTVQFFMHPSKFPHPKNTTVQKLTLPQARTIATFPIAEPEDIPGWHRVFSSGTELQANKSSKSNVPNSNDSPPLVVYLDEYTNGSNKKVVVMQEQDSVMTASNQTPWMHPTIKDPSNSEKINLGQNFGVYIPNENFLHVYDSTGSLVVGIYVWGTTSKENLETIAKAYLSATTG